MPLRSSQLWRSASEALASSTIPGTLSRNERDLVGDGVGEQQRRARRAPARARGRRSPPPAPRGKPSRRRNVTNGLSSSAISPATMNSRSTGPAARATAQRAEQRSGSMTSWIQRGTTTGATRAGGVRRRRPERERALGRLRALLAARPSSSGERPPRCRALRLACPKYAPRGPTSFPRRDRDPLRRRHRRLRRPPHAQGAAPGPARGARARLRRRQRRERRGRHRHHAEARRRAVRGRRRRDHARQPHLPPPRGLALPRRSSPTSCARPTSCAPSPAAAPACSSATASRSASSTCRATCSCRRARRRSRRSTRRCARSRAPTTCSSTCTPRRRARRSRWAGSSTAA